MAFCSACGAQTPEGTKLCPACSSKAPAGQSASGGLTDNVAGLLAYITFIPAIIFLVMEPYNKNKFIRFHSFQCLFFTVAVIALEIALMIVGVVLAFIPVIGHILLALLWPVIGLGIFILWIVLMLKAYQGQMFKLPVIGDMAEKQANA